MKTAIELLRMARDKLLLAEGIVVTAEAPYRTMIAEAQAQMEADPKVQRARAEWDRYQGEYAAEIELAKGAARSLIGRTGQKTHKILGWTISGREVAKREIADPVTCFITAFNENLHNTVFKAVKLTKNTKKFNAWIELKGKEAWQAGVQVTTELSITIKPPEKEEERA